MITFPLTGIKYTPLYISVAPTELIYPSTPLTQAAEVGCRGKETMASPIYKTGKQIRSISEVDQLECLFYKVKFGKNFRTIHRSFLISWQYRTLLIWIERGWVYEAERVVRERDTGTS